MTDWSKLTKEQLVAQLEAMSDGRPVHMHTDGTSCHSPYCVSLHDKAVPDA